LSTELAVRDFSTKEIETIKSAIAPTLNDSELQLFLQTCKRTGLDPFSRQIYSTVTEYKDKKGQAVRKVNIQATVDGLRITAERSGKYAGQVGPFWCGEDGKWFDVWLSRQPPLASKVGVIRTDFKEPVWAVAKYDSYVQNYSPVWQKMPEQMLAKCAESLAIRKAFPNDLSGIYTNEEMGQAEREVKAPVKQELDELDQALSSMPVPSFDEPMPTEFDDPHKEVTPATAMYKELDAWKIPFGKKYLGKTLLDIGLKNSKDYRSWLRDQVAKDGKEPSMGAKKFFDMVELYETYIQEVEQQQKANVHSPRVDELQF